MSEFFKELLIISAISLAIAFVQLVFTGHPGIWLTHFFARTWRLVYCACAQHSLPFRYDFWLLDRLSACARFARPDRLVQMGACHHHVYSLDLAYV